MWLSFKFTTFFEFRNEISVRTKLDLTFAKFKSAELVDFGTRER